MSFVYKIIFIICIPMFVCGQTWEIGLQLGPSNYQGDLANDIALKETHFSGGIFLKKNVSQFFTHSLYFMQGEISGNDNNFSHQKIRNLSFKETISEISYQLEFNFFPFSFGLKHKDFTPYVFTGLSIFHFNPQAVYNGQTVNLNKLDTEGNVASGNKKKPYSLNQVAIPIGGGFKYSFSDKIILGINVGFRSAFTDYIDDVSNTYFDKNILLEKNGNLSAALSDRSGEINSNAIGFMGKQRGRSDNRDWYIFSGIMISYRIRDSVCFEF